MIRSKRKIKSRIICARRLGLTLNLPLPLNHLLNLTLHLAPSLGDRRQPAGQSSGPGPAVHVQVVREHRSASSGAEGCNAASPCTLPCNRQVTFVTRSLSRVLIIMRIRIEDSVTPGARAVDRKSVG